MAVTSGQARVQIAAKSQRRWHFFAARVACRVAVGCKAPELTTSLRAASNKAYVWSLGMTFYTMVMFHVPYEGLRWSMASV